MPRFMTHEGVAFDGCIVTFDRSMRPWFVEVACAAVRFWREQGKLDSIIHCKWKSGRVLNMHIKEVR